MKTFNTHGYGVKFYLELSALEKENFSAQKNFPVSSKLILSYYQDGTTFRGVTEFSTTYVQIVIIYCLAS